MGLDRPGGLGAILHVCPTPANPSPTSSSPTRTATPSASAAYAAAGILFAFPKANAPGCTTQSCGFRDEFPKIEAGDTAVLGVSPDTPKKLRAWKDA